jgi:CubicO group peptidase (beta-lactamase class C family)
MKLPLILALGLLMTACSTKNVKNSLTFELDSLFKQEFHKYEPGGAILVKKGDSTVFLKCYGLADLKTKEKITENTVFNLGSISKTFVSNGILILKSKGLLLLEDSIFKYFPDFKNESIAKKIKIKHLLSHTSGLPDLRKVDDNIAFFITAKDKENFEPIKQADSLHFEPGEKYEYSNPAFNGLALIIEKVTGQQWQKFITEKIFKPSGMVNSKITDGAYPQNGVAHAYEFVERKFTENDYGEYPTFAAAGNGGIWSSVLELAKYEKAIQQNIFLNKELTDESRSVFYPQNWTDTIKPFIGYSWFIGEESLFGKKSDFNVNFVYHTGSQGGFRAFYITIPEKNILFVGLFNRPLKDFKRIIYESIAVLKRNNWLE